MNVTDDRMRKCTCTINTLFFNIRVAVADIDKLYKSLVSYMNIYAQLKKMNDEHIRENQVTPHIRDYIKSVSAFLWEHRENKTLHFSGMNIDEMLYAMGNS